VSEPDAASQRLAAIAQQMRAQYRTATQMASAAIRQAILDAVYPPGQPLNVYDLAAWLGLSRTPVRTALAELSQEGLVVTVPRRGAVVAEPDTDDFLQVCEVWGQLELLALQKAVDAMTPQRLAELDRRDEGLAGTPEDTLTAALDDFYAVLYDAAQNPLLVDTIHQLRTEVHRYAARLRIEPAAVDRHGLLLEYVRAGDLAGAQRYLSDHLQSLRRRVA